MRTEQADVGPLTKQFNLLEFTRALITDLQALRAGKISVPDARARAELAKQVLKTIAISLSAQKFLAASAQPVDAKRIAGAPRRRGED